MDKLVITRARDLSISNFACYMDPSFNPVALKYAYDDTTLSLTLTSTDGSNIPFDAFKSIHFGNNVTDINLCNPASYNYQIKNGVLPDLSGTSVSFVLSNMASFALPDIKVTLRMIAPTIVNV
jgi:hypothetical protein